MGALKLAKKSPNAENNITKTGYRALFLLLKLIEAPRTADELINLVSVDPILKNDKIYYFVIFLKEFAYKNGVLIIRGLQRKKK